MKKAFSLIEMILVVGIITILMAVLIGSFSGGTESARSVRCLSNLHNLSAAWNNRSCNASSGLITETFMHFGQISEESMSNPVGGELNGWIGWYSKGLLPRKNAKTQLFEFEYHLLDNAQSPDWFISTYCEDPDARNYCLTNGLLWTVVGCNHNVYLCPTHYALASAGKLRDGEKRVVPLYSYVLNGQFDTSFGASIQDTSDIALGGINPTKTTHARTLLFAELPFQVINDKGDGNFQIPNFTTEPGSVNDACLQSKDCDPLYKGPAEAIGFNHKVGNRWVAHISFVDGHAEKLTKPRSMTKAEAIRLTQLLANGVDYGYNEKTHKYESYDPKFQ